MSTSDETPVPVILPPEVQAKIDRGEPMTVRCPAGEPIRDRRGHQGVLCKIEREPLSLAGSAIAIACFCCHEYGECPTWQADQDEDPVVKRQHMATEQRRQDRLTEGQVAHGVRIDDREEREHHEWMEEELRRQESGDYPHEEDEKGQSSIVLPPGYDPDRNREEEDDDGLDRNIA